VKIKKLIECLKLAKSFKTASVTFYFGDKILEVEEMCENNFNLDDVSIILREV
jgi:hypothetical protein